MFPIFLQGKSRYENTCFFLVVFFVQGLIIGRKMNKEEVGCGICMAKCPADALKLEVRTKKI